MSWLHTLISLLQHLSEPLGGETTVAETCYRAGGPCLLHCRSWTALTPAARRSAQKLPRPRVP